MSVGDLIDDDADIAGAVSKIMARGVETLGPDDRDDMRENREDREAHEMAEDADMDARPEPVETKGKDGSEEAAEDGGEQFLEIPGESEDAETVKIPLSEAAEAVKQIRQMNGDIAAAVIRAETEAQEKSEKLIEATAETYRQVRQTAETAVRLMQQFLPQPPDKSMLDDRSENYDPQGYYARRAYYDEYVAFAQKIHATVAQATSGEAAVLTEAQKLEIERENARTARYIPEWGKEETRAAKKAEIVNVLKSHYGLTDDDVNGIASHKAWRILNDRAKDLQVHAKAPEIKKSVQEKAAKLVKGKMPPRDTTSGQFVSRDREQLRKTGSVDDAARLFMRSGLTRNL